MKLDRVISALLPRRYRAQVLGDLQERGFRWWDIANVLPRVWWSHALRNWTNAIPSSDGASATEFSARTRTLALHGRILTALGLTCVGMLASPPWFTFGLVWFAFQSWSNRAEVRSPFPDDRLTLRAGYRQELDRQIDFVRWNPLGTLICFAVLIPRVSSGSATIMAFSGLAILVALNRVRLARLRRELGALQNPSSLA